MEADQKQSEINLDEIAMMIGREVISKYVLEKKIAHLEQIIKDKEQKNAV